MTPGRIGLWLAVLAATAACTRDNPAFGDGESGDGIGTTRGPGPDTRTSVDDAMPTGPDPDTSSADGIEPTDDDTTGDVRLDLGPKDPHDPGEVVQCPFVLLATNATGSLLLVSLIDGNTEVFADIGEPSNAVASRSDGLIVATSIGLSDYVTTVDIDGKQSGVMLNGNRFGTPFTAAAFTDDGDLVLMAGSGDLFSGSITDTINLDPLGPSPFPVGGDFLIRGDRRVFAGNSGNIALADPSLTSVLFSTSFPESFTGAAVDAEGRVWVSTVDSQLLKLSFADQRITVDDAAVAFGPFTDLAPLFLPAEQCAAVLP